MLSFIPCSHPAILAGWLFSMHVFIHESRQREGEMLGRLRTASGNLKIEGWGVTYENGICAGIDAPAAGQAGDTDGKPTAWEPADLPGGGGNEWVKVAETTLTEIVNEIRLNFDPCKAVYLEFQYGAVENDLGVTGIPLRTAGRRA